ASIVIAGLMAKTGAYGLLRFAIPLFPEAAARFAPIAMAFAVIGLLYGAVAAFGQTDAKRTLAYASLSHVGLITLGVFAWTQLAMQGVVFQMVCHGIILAALFWLVGALDARIHTRDFRQISGLWASLPRLGGVTLLFALALMGLPGLGSFVGEFLVLLGTFSGHEVFAIIAALGMIAAVIYALWLVQRVFHGESRADWHVPDLTRRELGLLAALIVLIVGLGLYPQPVLDTVEPSLANLRQGTATTFVAEPPPSSGPAVVFPDGKAQLSRAGGEAR
ncbi:MAG TPA: NADH-quinone oxidoreductase subunit M, partial [Chloroflexota bacterium]|nr:NADH-quinone oxidoreductase subunit M [Chloroflexota bacterium]